MIQCMAYMVVVCTLSVFFLVIKASLIIPDNANHLILLNDDLMESFFDTFDLSDMWIVTMLSGSLETDVYIPLHMGGIMEATRNLPNVFYIFYQISPTNNFIYSLGNFFSKLPDTSIIVSLQHGHNRVQIPYLEYLVQSKIIKPHIIFHLNHEKPWEEELSLDFIYPTIGELQDAYSSQKLVIRNYYYEPLLGSSLYLPVGVPFRSRTFLNETSRWYRVRNKHSLDSRNRFCFFKGRLRYNTELNNERRSIFSLKLQQNKLQMCTIEELSEMEVMSMTVLEANDQFLEIMVDTVFALCPGGNNPETFRMFEALEAGAIPIVIKIQDANRDYFKHLLWKGYPGPVLNDWSELDSFLLEYSDKTKLRLLYNSVFSWYDGFWSRVDTYIFQHIIAVSAG